MEKTIKEKTEMVKNRYAVSLGQATGAKKPTPAKLKPVIANKKIGLKLVKKW